MLDLMVSGRRRRGMSEATPFPSLHFNKVELVAVKSDGKPWFTAEQIGLALGYGQRIGQIDVPFDSLAAQNAVNRIYARHADEFTPAMTAEVVLPTPGGPQKTRVFSPRGCHLLAMFARTPVAKAFRRWILDILDALAEGEEIKFRRWKKFADSMGEYALNTFEAGRAYGKLYRCPPQRQRLIFFVCSCRDQGNTYKQIAFRSRVSVHAVRGILRRHYADLTEYKRFLMFALNAIDKRTALLGMDLGEDA
jgi:prophage antirepressor-like protein